MWHHTNINGFWDESECEHFFFGLTSKLKKIPQDLPKGEVPTIWVWFGSTGFKERKPISFGKQPR